MQTSSAASLVSPDPSCVDEAWGFPFSAQDWAATPELVREHLTHLQEQNDGLRAQIDDLLARLRVFGAAVDHVQSRLRKNSKNSDCPPSSDNPYRKKPSPANPSKAGAKKGHRGHAQTWLPATHPSVVVPQGCTCGHTQFTDLVHYHTHQEVELPDAPLEVRHFLLHEATCIHCGERVKAGIPRGHQTG